MKTQRPPLLPGSPYRRTSSSARQARDPIPFAADVGYVVIRVFKETGSGAKADRPERHARSWRLRGDARSMGVVVVGAVARSTAQPAAGALGLQVWREDGSSGSRTLPFAGEREGWSSGAAAAAPLDRT